MPITAIDPTGIPLQSAIVVIEENPLEKGT
jgi:hypothetical protein